MANDETRPYDVIVYGATGFTGRLVSTHLRSHKEQPHWAIAGRSQKRLEEVKSSLKLPDQVGVVIADNQDEASLEDMARQARCIINLVGPYRQFRAEKIIEACITHKTDYVDLTGETSFTAMVIEKYHEKAKQAGVVIACSSGYDSVPSDITTYLSVQHFERINGPQASVEKVHVSTRAGPIPLEINGAFSTGTLLSLVDMADENPRNLAFDEPGRLSPLVPFTSTMPFHFASEESHFGRGKYGCSWILAPHNIRIVYRSWGLLQSHRTQDSYGDDFQYTESLHAGSYGFCLGQAVLFYLFNLILASMPSVRNFMKKNLPPNGGPSEKAQQKMKVDVRAIASSPASAGRKPYKSVLCALHANGHPGYSVTAVLISEVGLTLALEDRKNLHELAREGGCLTVATIGAEKVAERLRRNAGYTIDCTEFDG